MYIMYICTLIDGRKCCIITPDGLNQLKLTDGFACLKSWNRNGNTSDRAELSKKVWKSYTNSCSLFTRPLVTVWPTDGKCWRTGSFYIHSIQVKHLWFQQRQIQAASQCMTVNATPIYICRQIGNLWEAISNIMQSVGFSSPLKILIQKQLALTSWAGLLSGVYFHLCKPYRGEFREVQSLQFSPSIYCMLFSHLVCQ